MGFFDAMKEAWSDFKVSYDAMEDRSPSWKTVKKNLQRKEVETARAWSGRILDASVWGKPGENHNPYIYYQEQKFYIAYLWHALSLIYGENHGARNGYKDVFDTCWDLCQREENMALSIMSGARGKRIASLFKLDQDKIEELLKAYYECGYLLLQKCAEGRALPEPPSAFTQLQQRAKAIEKSWQIT